MKGCELPGIDPARDAPLGNVHSCHFASPFRLTRSAVGTAPFADALLNEQLLRIGMSGKIIGRLPHFLYSATGVLGNIVGTGFVDDAVVLPKASLNACRCDRGVLVCPLLLWWTMNS